MEDWLLWELPPKFQDLSRQLCFWSGFAIWVGLAVRFLLPAKFAQSAWLTLCIGFVGSCLGPFAVKSLSHIEKFDPVGPAGFIAATVVATVMLLLFHLVAFLAPPLNDEEDEEERNRREFRNDDPRRDDYERNVDGVGDYRRRDDDYRVFRRDRRRKN